LAIAYIRYNSTGCDAADQFFVDEPVFREAVKVEVMKLPHLAHLEVVSSLSGEQDSELIGVKFCKPALHLLSRSVLTNALSLNSIRLTEALTFSRKAFSFTYSK
jgi:hypothetical protein